MPLYNPENKYLKIINIINGSLAPREGLLDVGNKSEREAFILTASSGGVILMNFDEETINATNWTVRQTQNTSYNSPPFWNGKINLYNLSTTLVVNYKLVEFG